MMRLRPTVASGLRLSCRVAPTHALARTARYVRRLRAAAVCVLVAAALSGCGVFCGAAGGSGGGFAGGCGTGVRF
ncbi:hypothetical protein [Paraburkholderia caballeronis]|uniref:hypothetical protein n=1 Tax=Paraburkholderia caballeronis TaxID=416943 RepID=UPI00106711EB|nr:hypothetical protein [Paraburkholderia caballeronis]